MSYIAAIEFAYYTIQEFPSHNVAPLSDFYDVVNKSSCDWSTVLRWVFTAVDYECDVIRVSSSQKKLIWRNSRFFYN